MNFGRMLVIVSIAVAPAIAQEPEVIAPDPREREIRERYETILSDNPFQDSAFDRVYEAYMLSEGVDDWLEKLAAEAGETPAAPALVLRGRILARQLKTAEAIESLAAARAMGEAGADLDALLGRLYYEAGRDDEAIALLGAALESVTNPDARAEICRTLGTVYLRSGKRELAAEAWRRIVETAPDDLFALEELAEIYSANRMWDDAIAIWRRVADLAGDDPYRRCRALRAIGGANVAAERHDEAIAAYEAALDLAAPGNWLADDLKNRLVAVYESRGDLSGLVAYLRARIARQPGDLTIEELLAETHLRRGELPAAETVLQSVVARAPDRARAYEMLLRVYADAGHLEERVSVYETLIERFPLEPDYVRRLGEAFLQAGEPDRARETWRRVAGPDSGADDIALLAGWFERYEFYPEAAEAYERALSIRVDREWQLRLAALRYDLDDTAGALTAWMAIVAPEDTPAAEVAEVAGLLLAREFTGEARALYGRAMMLDPENLEYVLAAARIAAGLCEHGAAAALFEHLAGQDSNEYFKTRGEQGLLESYAALGTIDEHRAAWEAAIAARPEDAAPRLKLARLYAQSGNRPGAVTLYETCVAIAPDNVSYRRMLADAYRHNRQHERAIETLRALMEMDRPRAAGYLRDLLALYEEGSRAADAIAAAESLVEITPASPESRSELAAIYLRHGEQEKALQQLRNAIRLDNDEPAYYRALGDALANGEQFGEAREIYWKMVDVARDAPTRLDGIGRLAGMYARAGQQDAIVSEFQQRLQASPKSLAAYEELAAVHRSLGRQETAMEVLESARGQIEDREAFVRLVLAEAYRASDYARVVSLSEELLALSGEPTLYDLDRLAEGHARNGDLERAVHVWERVSREHNEDPAAQVLVARALQRNGYAEESLPYLARALELDPYDYRLRFDYANQLVALNLLDEAAAQFHRILEIGERPPEAADPGTAQPGGASPVQASGAVVASGPYGVGPFAPHVAPLASVGVGQRGFAEFRPGVIQAILQVARLAGDEEAIVEAFRKKAADDPENTDARFDFLLVCEHAGEHELALETALELAVIYPEDAPLQWRILQFQRQLARPDEAIRTAAGLAEGADENLARQAMLALIGLYLENDQPEEARAAIDHLAARNPDNAAVYLQLAYTMRSMNRMDDAVAFFKKAAEIEPRQQGQILAALAQLFRQQGETDKAREYYMEVLFHRPEGLRPPNSPQAAQPYLPNLRRNGPRLSGHVGRLPHANFRFLDHQKADAFNQIAQMTLDDAELATVVERVRREAGNYAVSETPEDVHFAANYVLLHVAYLRNARDAESALDFVRALDEIKPDDPLLRDLHLYLLDDLDRFAEMGAIYDAMERDRTAGAADLARARLHLALANREFEQVPALYRAAAVHGGQQNYLGMVVAALKEAGAGAAAISLLEEALASSRDPQLLTMLSQAYTGTGEHDKAIALAWEAWQTKSTAAARLGQPAGVRPYAPGMEVTLHSLGVAHLAPLWNAHKEAGRSEELLQAFREKVEGQPGSLSLRLSLAGLYCQEKRLDLARAELAELSAQRPNDLQFRFQYASLLEATGELAAALEVLEEAARDRVGSTRNLAQTIQRLYKALNKTEALASLRARMIGEARSAGELTEIAQNLAADREYKQAAELMERAYRMEPDSGGYIHGAGEHYWSAGETDAALRAYTTYLEYGVSRPDAGVGVRQLEKIIGHFDAAGKMEELKSRVAGAAVVPPARFSIFLDALIAKHEKDFDTAAALLKGHVAAGDDSEAYMLLADIAEDQGDLDAAIAYVEKAAGDRQIVVFQRLASIYLKKGDTARAIAYWKKQAEIQNGYRGHAEGIGALIAAGELDAAETYFREVYDRIPAADWVRREMASDIVEEHVKTGAFGALIEEVIFTGDNPHAQQLVHALTEDYHSRPDAAHERLAPIVRRLPDSVAVRARLSEIQERRGDFAAAAESVKRLMTDTEQEGRNYYRYTTLLGRAGLPDAQLAFARRWIEEKEDPTADQISRAANTVRAAGGPAAFYQLRGALLAKADAGDRPRIEGALAPVLARSGGLAEARVAAKTWYEGQTAPEARVRYFSLLAEWGFQEEAAAVYASEIAPNGESQVPHHSIQAYTKTLVATGDIAGACKLSLLSRQPETGHIDPRDGNGIRDLIRLLRDYNAPATALREVVDALEAKEALTINERLYLADYHVNMGNPERALALVSIDSGDYRTAEAARMIRQALPFDGGGAPPSQDDDGATPEALLEQGMAAARHALAQDDRDAAVALLDSVTIPEELGHVRMERAQIYLNAGAHEKAIAAGRAALERDPENSRADQIIALAKVAGGDIAGAMADWRALKERGVAPRRYEFALPLVEGGHYEEAREVLYDPEATSDPDLHEDLLAARLLHESGQADAIVDEMEIRHGAARYSHAEILESRYGEFLRDTGLWERFLTLAGASRPALSNALLSAADTFQDDGDKPRAEQIAAALTGVEFRRPERAAAFARLLHEIGQSEDALEALRRYPVESVTESWQGTDIVQFFVTQKAWPDAAAAMMALCGRFPEVLDRADTIIQIAAGGGEDPAAAALFQRFQEHCHTEVHKEYNRARLVHAARGAEAGLPLYEPLIEAPGMEGGWLVQIATDFQQQGRSAEALRALERLCIPGEFPSDVADSAAADAAAIHAATGDPLQALRHFAALLPAHRHTAARAYAAILENASRMPEGAGALLAELINAAPEHPRVPELIALRAKLAKSDGTQFDPAEWEAPGLSPRGQFESVLWARRLDMWRVSEAFDLPDGAAMAAPLEEPLAAWLRGESGAGSVLSDWVTVEPGQVYSSVPLRTVKPDGPSANVAVYCAVVIESPEERTVTFAHGSDDRSRVWVNEAEVFSGKGERMCLMDQERFPATLKPGVNHVLVKCGNGRGNWEFTLSIVEGADGLVARLPGAAE